MAKRTINDAFFAYFDKDGRFLSASRGETVDIPEGDDLVRGDEFGAFTAEVGEEPSPPANTELVAINPAWEESEYDRFVDAAHIDEVLAKLDAVAPDDRAKIAIALIAAESRKSDGGRSTLIEKLGSYGNGAPVEPVTTDEPPVTTDTTDTVDFSEVLSGSVTDVLAYAQENPQHAQALLDGETAASVPRKGLLEGLPRFIDGQ